MLLRMAGTFVLGAGLWTIAIGAAVTDDVLARIRKAKDWGDLKI